MDEKTREELRQLYDVYLADIRDLVRRWRNKATRTPALSEIDAGVYAKMVRADWYERTGTPDVADEYYILIAGGGPAARVIGELKHGRPVSAYIEVQNWLTAWTRFHPRGDGAQEAEADLLTYAQLAFRT